MYVTYLIFLFRGCEGNDEESDITSDDEESDDSWDESLSQPTSGHEHSTSEDSDDEGDDTDDDDVPHRADGELPDAVYVPSVPERPRILSSSSSSSDSIPEVDTFDLVRNSLQSDLTKN